MSKISELAEATTLSDADMTVIDNETDGTRKFKLKRLKDASDGNATDIGKLQDSIADEYDVNISYSAGDYVMHEGILYKATDTTTGAWDSSKWSEAQISSDVNQLNSKMSNYYDGSDNNLVYKASKSNGIVTMTIELRGVTASPNAIITTLPQVLKPKTDTAILINVNQNYQYLGIRSNGTIYSNHALSSAFSVIVIMYETSN